MNKLQSFLAVILLNLCASSSSSSCPEIISRKRWSAREALQVEHILVPVENVVVHHTVTQKCHNESECASVLKKIQNFHMEKNEFSDIGYNFLVGGDDGLIFEGAGWHTKGSHTKGYNSRSLGLAFIGTYTDELPNEKQLQAAKNFLQCGVDLGELKQDYKLYGARQLRNTDSPGLKLYHEIQNWPHFTRLKTK